MDQDYHGLRIPILTDRVRIKLPRVWLAAQQTSNLGYGLQPLPLPEPGKSSELNPGGVAFLSRPYIRDRQGAFVSGINQVGTPGENDPREERCVEFGAILRFILLIVVAGPGNGLLLACLLLR
jgi:hypothetical protein